MNILPENMIKTSFFDDADIEANPFWKKRTPEQKLNDTKLMEGYLYRKSSKNANWKLRFFILYEDRLVFHKHGLETKDKQEQRYCLIENMRLEPVVNFRGQIDPSGKAEQALNKVVSTLNKSNTLNTIVETAEENNTKDGAEAKHETSSAPQSTTDGSLNASTADKKELDEVADERPKEVVAKEVDRSKEEIFGFKLIHNKQAFDLYIHNTEQQDMWLASLSRLCILTCYSASFANIKAIGKGSFARVYLAKRRSDDEEFAVKTFGKDLLAQNDKAKPSLINEINIMRKLEQDNIIRLYNIYESDHHIYLVLELLKGGELFDRIVQRGQYDESDACTLMQKLLSSLAYMHSKGIMHRDLKPENLILKGSENDSDVKIADFGLATFMNMGDQLFKRCGTPGYVAPEILADQQYNEKVDIFSAGVILYVLLTGGSPFYSDSYNEILWKNKECQINFNFREFGHRISPQAVDLMKRMLDKDPVKRISAQEALEHQWIQVPAYFTSPQSNSRVFLNMAQQNMKKLQEEHLNKMKAQITAGNNLERSIHAPSPLITGRTIAINDANVVGFASPEMSVGAALAARQRLANLKSPLMTPDVKSRAMMTPNMQAYARNINQYIASTPQMNSRGQLVQNPNKGAVNVQENLMKYLQGNKGAAKAPVQASQGVQFQQNAFAQPGFGQANNYQPQPQPVNMQSFMPGTMGQSQPQSQPQPQPQTQGMPGAAPITTPANPVNKASNVKDRLKGLGI